MKRILLLLTLTAAVVSSFAVQGEETPRYLGPCSICQTSDGAFLFVVNMDGKSISKVDLAGKSVAAEFPTPATPTGIAISKDDKTLYVTVTRPEGELLVMSAENGVVEKTIAVGHTPCSPCLTPDGKRVYVCNQFNNNVSVVDLEQGKEIAKVPVVREPVSCDITPDGKTVFVANFIPNDRADGYDVASEIGVIDTATNTATSIRLINGCSSVHEIRVSPDGKYAYATNILARYQMPTTQVERGWMNTNALAVIDVEAKKLVNVVLLDDIDLGAANPYGIAFTPDSKTLLVTHSGTSEMSIIDNEKMIEKLLAMPEKTTENAGIYTAATAADVPNDLSFLVGMRNRVRLKGVAPRSIVVTDNKAYTPLYFSDEIDIVNLRSKRCTGKIELGPQQEMSKVRKGQMFFGDASLCFQQWQSCATCHPNARVDALNWDLMNDGMGNPKNAKSLFRSDKTPPTMISGIRPDHHACVRKGIQFIQFAVRPEEDAQCIDEFIEAMEAVPSPYLVNGQLSEKALKGKEVFKKAKCDVCHGGEYYTDMQMHNVKTRAEFDQRDDWDTPTLLEVWRTAPYLHDGRYVTMKELFVEGKHELQDVQLTEEEIEALCEYVLSL